MITLSDGNWLDNGLCVFYCCFDRDISVTLVRWRHAEAANQHINVRVAYGFDPQPVLDEIINRLDEPADATEIGAVMTELSKAAKEVAPNVPNKSTCSSQGESEKTPL